MAHKKAATAAAGVMALAGGLGSAAAQEAGPRFSPLTEDRMTAEQKASPSASRALEAGRYNPAGYDSILLRRPGLMEAFAGVLTQVYPPASRTSATPSTMPTGPMEIAILTLAHEWRFPAMFKSHGVGAVKAGVSQETVDALAEGRRPSQMPPVEAAVYDFTLELLRTREVSDATFQRLRAHLSERDVVDMLTTLGLYTTSLMILKVADSDSH